MKYPTLHQANLAGKRVLLRAGFDVPMENGVISDTSRIEALVPTMKYILENGASLIIMAHQGRPKDAPDPAFSQQPLVPVLEKLLGTTVQFANSCTGADTKVMADSLEEGSVLLLENLRFDPREKKNDPEFAKELASLADVYVNDAFTNCHRDHASMTGVPRLLPSYMGLQLESEVENLSKASVDPRRPLTLIISGAKMETKVPVIEPFLMNGDDVLLGGCIANTFIAARGFNVAASKYEQDFMEKAQDMMLESEKEDRAMIHVPHDAVVASELSATAEKIDLPVEDIEGDMSIFDIGTKTLDHYEEVIAKSGTIIWNGPMGVCEFEQFAEGSKRIAAAMAAATKRGAITLIGGGDTLDFHERYGIALDAYTFVSTGGGAMLDFVSGQKMPALLALEQSS